MTLTHRPNTLGMLTVRIAAAVALSTALIALAVHVALARPARAWLQFPFPAQHPSLGLAVTIFANNLRGLAAITGLALIVRAPTLFGRAPNRGEQLLHRGGELLLATAIAGNIVLIGAAFGGYGARMVLASLPQAPFELAAYALALAGYLQQRDDVHGIRGPLTAAGGALGLLGLAALLEVFVPS